MFETLAFAKKGMERLIVELEKVSVQGSFENKFTENNTYSPAPVDCPRLLKFTVKNCFPNMSIRCDEQMPEKRLSFRVDDIDNALDNSDSNSTENSYDGQNEINDEDGSGEVTPQALSGGNRKLRNLPQRTRRVMPDCKKRNLRIPMKPPKISAQSTAKLRLEEIKKLYSIQKLTNFRPTKLETIFEEPLPMRSHVPNTLTDTESQFRLIGSTKLKRSLTCSDGFNTKKSLINQRRAKIKKNFGRRRTWKKMPLGSFMQHIQSNLSDESEQEDDACKLQKSLLPNEIPLSTKVITEVKELEKMGD